MLWVYHELHRHIEPHGIDMDPSLFGGSEGVLFVQVGAPWLWFFGVIYVESRYFAKEYGIDSAAALSRVEAVFKAKQAAGFTTFALMDANSDIKPRPGDDGEERDTANDFGQWLQACELVSAQTAVKGSDGQLHADAPCRSSESR